MLSNDTILTGVKNDIIQSQVEAVARSLEGVVPTGDFLDQGAKILQSQDRYLTIVDS